MSNTLENPMLLFGDIRPDVIELSKIYDPDNDLYVRSTDDHVVEGTTYYERQGQGSVIEGGTIPVPTFTYEEVTNPPEDANPYAEGWYVYNAYGKDQTGCYIPADRSIVVVDKGTDFYKEFTVLIVASVDRDCGTDDNPRVPTYKAKLVPVNLGTGEEVTARTLDYGNKDMYLYLEDVIVPNPSDPTTTINATRVTPDRKLMLFGQRYYTYRIMKQNVPIVGPTPGAHEGRNAAVSYICAGASKIQLTADNIEALVGKQFDVVDLNRVMRFKIPAAGSVMYTLDTAISETKDYYTWNPFLHHIDETGKLVYDAGEWTKMIRKGDYLYYPTMDAKTVVGKTYYKADTTVNASGETVYQSFATITAANEQTIYDGEKAYQYNNGTTVVPSYISVLYERVTNGDPMIGGVSEIIEDPKTSPLIGLVGYVHNDERAALENIFYPAAGYRGENFTLTDGETVDMEVYEIGNEEFDRLVTPRTSPKYTTAVTTRVGDTSFRMIMNVSLIVRAGTAWNAGEGSSKQIVGFDVPNDDSAPNDPNVWYLLPTDTKASLPKEAVLTFDDNSKKKVPIDNKACFMYGLDRLAKDEASKGRGTYNLTLGVEYPLLFKYFPQSQLGKDWEGVTVNRAPSFVTCRKTVKCVNAAADQVRKISIVPIWDDSLKRYRFKFLAYDVNMRSPMLMTLASATDETQTDPNVSMTIKYQTGNTEYTIDPEQAGATYNMVYHAWLAYKASIDNYKTTLYSQGVSFCLQDWTDVSAGVEKWRIGDNMESWDIQTLGYGKDGVIEGTNFIRPYFVYDRASRTFRCGPRFTDKDMFVEQFYRLAYKSSSSADIPLAPTHFRVRAVDSDNVANRMNESGNAESIFSLDKFNAAFMLSSVSAVTTPGGAIPDRNLQLSPVMGLVICEFIAYRKINGVNQPCALYGVPVEVRDASW